MGPELRREGSGNDLLLVEELVLKVEEEVGLVLVLERQVEVELEWRRGSIDI